MHEQIEKLILWANYALENSGVFTAGFNLAGSVRLENYLESEDPLGRDFFLYATGDAFVSQLREEYSADLIAYFCTDHHCGNTLKSPASSSFRVLLRRCVAVFHWNGDHRCFRQSRI